MSDERFFTLGDQVKTRDNKYSGMIIGGVLNESGAQWVIARNISNPSDRKVYETSELELVEPVSNQRLGV